MPISDVLIPSARRSMVTRGITTGSTPMTFSRFPVKATSLRCQPSTTVVPMPSITNFTRRTFYTPEPNLQQNFTPIEEVVLDVAAWSVAVALAYSFFWQYDDDEEDDDVMDEERSKYYQEQKEFHERRRQMKEQKEQERLNRSRLRRQQRAQQAATVACHHEETGGDHPHDVEGSSHDENPERRRDL